MTYVNMMPDRTRAEYTREGLWSTRPSLNSSTRRPRRIPTAMSFADAHGASAMARSRTESCAAPNFIVRIGIKRGDVVTIQLPNWIEFAVAFIRA